MPELDKLLELANHYGLGKLCMLLVLMYALKTVKPLIDAWVDERKRLIDALNTAHADLNKLASNHMSHMQEAIENGSKDTQQNQKEIIKGLGDLAQSQGKVADAIGNMNEGIKQGFEILRENIRDQK